MKARVIIKSLTPAFVHPPLRELKGRAKLRLKRRYVLGEYSLRPFEANKAIFVHVPKTAGIAVARGLFGNLAGGHMSLRDYEHIFRRIYKVQDFDQYFIFTIVRNPWDRFVSAYEYLRKGGRNEYDEELARRSVYQFDTFDRFVQNWVTPANVERIIHFRPQVSFLTNESGQIGAHFIGRYENLEEDFNHIAERLGTHAQLQEHNRLSRSDFRTYYSRTSADIVRSVYWDDIKQFKYQSGDPMITAIHQR